MSESMISELTFTSYLVDEILFVRNPNFEYGNEAPSLRVALKTNVQISEDHQMALVTMGCTMFDETFDNGTAPFHLKTALTGHFSCQEDIQIDRFQPNAVSILLPYLRAVISSFTAQAGIPPVIMPPINVYKLLESQSMEVADTEDTNPSSE